MQDNRGVLPARWGYRYLDWPEGSVNECPEDEARMKAQRDWSVEVMYTAGGSTLPWVAMSTRRPDGTTS